MQAGPEVACSRSSLAIGFRLVFLGSQLYLMYSDVSSWIVIARIWVIGFHFLYMTYLLQNFIKFIFEVGPEESTSAEVQ